MSRAILTLGFLLGLSAGLSASVIDGFETQSLGDLNGQENWTVILQGASPPTAPGASVVTSPAPFEGSKSLHIVDNTTGWVDARKSITPILSSGTIFKFAVRPMFDPGDGRAGMGIWAPRTLADGTFPIERGSIYFIADLGQIWMYDGANFTTLSSFVKDHWYDFELTSNTDGGGNISQHVKITDTTTNSLLYNNTLSAGNDAGRTHYGSIRLETFSAPTAEYQVDGFAIVPEPMSMSLVGLGALALRRRK